MAADDKEVLVYEAEISKDCPYEDLKEHGSGFVVNLDDLVDNLKLWKKEAPNLRIYYPLKASSDSEILKTLALCGLGIHGNSKYEIEKAIEAGFEPDKIICAFPYKTQYDFNTMKKHGVSLTVAHCQEEIINIHQHMPGARVLLRVWVFAESQQAESCRFSCLPLEVDEIARTAARLGVNIVGVSFHTTFFIIHKDCSLHSRGVQIAAEAMERLQSHGFNMEILNIGGGFPSSNDVPSFSQIMTLTGKALSEISIDFPEIEVIGEPGTFLVKETTNLYMQVIGKRQVTDPVKGEHVLHYTVNQSRFKALSLPFPIKLIIKDTRILPETSETRQYRSHIWGNCCPPDDHIQNNVLLPELHIGSWICVKGVGAYNVELQTTFQCYPATHVIYTSNKL